MSRQQNYGAVSTSDVEFDTNQRSSKFNTLCDSVVTNIYTINSTLKTLEKGLKTVGTKRDNQSYRNTLHVTQLSTNQIASAATKDFHALKKLVNKNDKQQLLQVEKLESNFKEAVTRYNKLQKEVANKQKTHLLIPVSAENEYEENPEENAEQQRQSQLAREQAFEQEMLLEREVRIKQIEADVLDVNQIMRDLGSIVHEQSEVVDRIENNIDHAVGNVEEGTAQLVTASGYANRYRRKLLYLIILGVVIVAVLILIIVLSVKK